MHRFDIKTARSIIGKIESTVEKVDLPRQSQIQGIILRKALWTLKLAVYEIDMRMSEKPSENEKKLWKEGFITRPEWTSYLLKLKEDVNNFSLVMEVLIFFSVFALKVENISEAIQYGDMMKFFIESHIKKVEDEDPENLLLEVMIFCKNNQIAENTRHEIYYLVVIGLGLYICSRANTLNLEKIELYKEKIRSMGRIIEPTGILFKHIEGLIKKFKVKEEIKKPSEDLEIGEEVELERNQPHARNLEINIIGDSLQMDKKAELELIEIQRRKKKLEERNVKKKEFESTFLKGIYINTSGPMRPSSSLHLNTSSQNLQIAEGSEKEMSLKKNPNTKIFFKEEGNSILLQDNVSLKYIKDIESPNVTAQFGNAISSKQSLVSEQVLNSSAYKKSDYLIKKGARSQSGSGHLKLNLTKTANQSTVNGSLLEKKTHTRPVSGLHKKPQTDNSAFLLVTDNMNRAGSKIFEDSTVQEKKSSSTNHLKKILAKANLKELMPDQYIFDKFKPQHSPSKKDKWGYEKLTTTDTGSAHEFDIDKNWFHNRMMCSRLGEEPDRVLTNNKTMNLKNHQVMIEFKTGEHQPPEPPKKRPPDAYKKKSMMIKASFDHKKPEEFDYKKGVPLGYTDYQYEVRRVALEKHKKEEKEKKKEEKEKKKLQINEHFVARPRLSIRLDSNEQNFTPSFNAKNTKDKLGASRQQKKRYHPMTSKNQTSVFRGFHKKYPSTFEFGPGENYQDDKKGEERFVFNKEELDLSNNLNKSASKKNNQYSDKDFSKKSFREGQEGNYGLIVEADIEPIKPKRLKGTVKKILKINKWSNLARSNSSHNLMVILYYSKVEPNDPSISPQSAEPSALSSKHEKASQKNAMGVKHTLVSQEELKNFEIAPTPTPAVI